MHFESRVGCHEHPRPTRRAAWVGAVLSFVLILPSLAFIERLTPLQNLISDADFIFVAKVSSLDRDKLTMVLTAGEGLKGKSPLTRMPINLVGDKEKHTPQLLERLERDLPVVVFVTSLESKQLGLVYTHGTWFQILGQSAAGDTTVRWSFTHCEIYLRRTFIGSTDEMKQIVRDVEAGKRKAPPPNPKEKPGFGAPVKRAESGDQTEGGSARGGWRTEDGGGRAENGGSRTKNWVSLNRSIGGPLSTKNSVLGTQYSVPSPQDLAFNMPPYAAFSPQHPALNTPTLAVVGLPVLMPIVALLQLLFPGLLRDQWRQYRVAVQIVLTQSTVMTAQWIALRWFVSERTWWLSDEALWVALVVVAAVGAIWSSARRVGERTPEGQRIVKSPVSVEYVALSMLLVAGVCWTTYLWLSGSFPIDQMTVVSVAAVAAIGHLVMRRVRCGIAGTRVAWFTTELVFLWCLAAGGTAVGMFVNAREGNKQAESVVAEWPTFRGSVARLGTTRADDPGLATRPTVLWSFDPRERKGRVRFHSSPTVVDGQLYIGALHEVSTLIEGYLYCISTRDSVRTGGEATTVPLTGERLWQFTAGGTLKPVFSSPTVSDGRVFIGEGYHQDTGCRLFCLDARNGDRMHWSLATTSHVESSATVANGNVIFGAGDDGLICFAASIAPTDASSAPPLKWIVKNLHVDASPAVADGRVIVGSVVGDVHRETLVLAVDVVSGSELWRTPTPLAVPGSPAVADGRVFVGLGNGKVDHDADNPAGAVWCLDAESGEKRWEFRTSNAVLSTPAVSDGRVYACSRDEQCHCLNTVDGKVVWSTSLGGPIVGSPVVAGGRVYVVTTTGVVVCLDAATGSEVWRFDELDVPDADAYASPTLDGGRLYVAAGGKVYCLGRVKSEE